MKTNLKYYIPIIGIFLILYDGFETDSITFLLWWIPYQLSSSTVLGISLLYLIWFVL